MSAEKYKYFLVKGPDSYAASYRVLNKPDVLAAFMEKYASKEHTAVEITEADYIALGNTK